MKGMGFRDDKFESKTDMTGKLYKGQEDELFHEAVNLAAEEEGSEILAEYETASRVQPAEQQRIQYEAEVYKLYADKGSIKKFALKKRAIIFASCAVVFVLLCLPLSFKVWEATGHYADGQNAEEEAYSVFDHVFVYAEEKKYDLLKGKNIVLPDMNLQQGEGGGVVITGSIVGIEDERIDILTYECENGRLFGTYVKNPLESDKPEIREKQRHFKALTFQYYEEYYKDIVWVSDPEQLFHETKKSDADMSDLTPDVLTITAVMKDGTEQVGRIRLSYTEDGAVQARWE